MINQPSPLKGDHVRKVGLLSENSADKSTLVKIMTGAIRPDAGKLHLNGEEASFRSTAQALTREVAVVALELSLFPHLDILDNLFPMREPRLGAIIGRRAMRNLAMPVLEELGISRPLTSPFSVLSLAERQLLEIAKALISQPKVLLLDEPTSALEAGESARLLKILRILRDRNIDAVFVSHILEEVSTSRGLLDVSFHAGAGEIVGLAGLARSGPSAMLAAIAGLTPLSAGQITLPGGRTRPNSCREAVARGVAFVSGDRRTLGLMLDKPIWENINQVRSVGLSRDGNFLRTATLRDRAANLARRVGVKSPSVQLATGSLSGDNQLLRKRRAVLAHHTPQGVTPRSAQGPNRPSRCLPACR